MVHVFTIKNAFFIFPCTNTYAHNVIHEACYTVNYFIILLESAVGETNVLKLL